jgi:hypothetical protein
VQWRRKVEGVSDDLPQLPGQTVASGEGAINRSPTSGNDTAPSKSASLKSGHSTGT